MDELQNYYRGSFIGQPVGNNAFSYSLRKTKKIFVAPLKSGDLKDLTIGEEIVFSEMKDDQEVNCLGLKNFLSIKRKEKEIFIFDNHNHAFFFWLYWFKMGKIASGSTLVHVDQHRDTREPDEYFRLEPTNQIDLDRGFEYTNFALNVGNFIKPALGLNIFSGVEQIDNKEAFEKFLPDGFVLDIDIDIFSKEMDYIDRSYKIEKIRSFIDQARFITIATSPFFIEQEGAIQIIHELLE